MKATLTASLWRGEAPGGGCVTNVEIQVQSYQEIRDLLKQKVYGATLTLELPSGEVLELNLEDASDPLGVWTSYRPKG